tara:strand:+ start:92 stop:535 length:444 start_codon:yes stop_codon:yes gene_type:complete
MGNYTTILIAFGLMFSLYYIQATNLFGKIITGVFALLYATYYFKFIGVDPRFIYLLGLVAVIVYAGTQKHLEKIQRFAIGGFSLLIIGYIALSLIGLNLADYKIVVFFPLAVFAYIYYNKEDYEREMSFLNLMFIELLMTINIMLNS